MGLISIYCLKSTINSTIANFWVLSIQPQHYSWVARNIQSCMTRNIQSCMAPWAIHLFYQSATLTIKLRFHNLIMISFLKQFFVHFLQLISSIKLTVKQGKSETYNHTQPNQLAACVKNCSKVKVHGDFLDQLDLQSDTQLVTTNRF